ncbi:glutathione S-transferas-like protein [Elsinoe ampelina]|uniref:Glutathione S-transferas-like protein n=1 Tax=Elsinoe ampelina TaxID=302913 RepID=A0A6A6G9X5_9PEZI|nr:glutathione S-transferas-like protein [Elsinoe ampelina]
MSNGASDQPKIVLHWLEKSRAQRILWLLEECRVPYEIKTYKRVNQLAPPELKKIHPLGKSPIVTVQGPGQAEPLVLAESAFITEYLAEHFAKHLIPAQYKEGQDGKVGQETESWLRYRYFMHYAEGSFMSMLVTRYIVGALAGPQVPFFIKPITRAIVGKMNSMLFDPNMKTTFEFLESQIASSPEGGEFLCGKTMTGADILMSFPLVAVRDSMGGGLEKAKYPKLTEYVARLEKTDGYQASIKKAEEALGEKYSVL